MAKPKPPSVSPTVILLTSLLVTFTCTLFYLVTRRTSPLSLHLPIKPALNFLIPVTEEHASGARSDPAALQEDSRNWGVPLRQRLVSKRAAVLALRSGKDTLRTIAITDPLPSTLDLPASLLRTWDEAFNSLSDVATGLSASTLAAAKLQKKIKGVPGTGIVEDEEARALQEHLDCVSGRGEWVRDELGAEREASGRKGLTVHKQESIYASCDRRYYKGRELGDKDGPEGKWNVRESLKWRWVPSPSCAATAPSTHSPSAPLSRVQFCTLLAHKSTLVVGDSPQYSLHDLLLDWTSLSPQSCYGDLYCREHSLCGDVLRAAAEGRATEVDSWEDDERVYNRLGGAPSAPSLSKRSPDLSSTNASSPNAKRQLSKERSPSYGTLLRYRRSDGLRPSTKDTDPSHVHPSTAIREINQQWLADSRRSDIVILSKAPLPLPKKGHNETWDALYERKKGASVEQQASQLIQAAWHLTEEVWLPELMETLKAVRGPPSPLDQLAVYRGGWRAHADCGASSDDSQAKSDSSWPTSVGDGPPPHSRQPSLSSLLFRGSAASLSTKRLTDRHTLFFNLQTIFQNYILRTVVLPEWGVPFLDLETPLSVWRSGMVGGSAAAPFSSVGSEGLVDQTQVGSQGYGRGAGVGLRSAANGDCSRYCVPSPGGAIEEAFIGGLLRIFERGWGSTSARRSEWVGDGFANLRERIG